MMPRFVGINISCAFTLGKKPAALNIIFRWAVMHSLPDAGDRAFVH